MQEILSETRQKLAKAREHIAHEFNLLRTGKAAPQLLDPVRVEAYGASMTLQEVASVAVQDSSLVISPWDKQLLEAIEKGVNAAQLNLQPVVDSDHIRINVPPLTEERRLEMVKVLQQKLESGKVMVRTIRQDARKDIEKMKDEAGISEDDIAAGLDQLEEIIKKELETIDEMGDKKEAELMKV